MSETLEQEARKLRDIIYQDAFGPISDKSWANIKDNCIADIEWLREKANKPLQLFNNIPARKEEIIIKNDIVEKVC